MRKILLFLFLPFLSCIAVLGQDNIELARQESWQSFVYRIPADTAEMYAEKWDINVDAYLAQTPFATWNKHVDQFELLPPGNYVIISVEKNELVAKYYCKSNIRLMPINNQHTLQFELRDSTGNTGIKADIWLDGEKLRYDQSSQVHISHMRKAKEAIVKVVSGTDTSFFELTALENFTRSRWRQWWNNFYHRKPVYFLSSPVRILKKMIATEPAYWFRKNKYYRNLENGYVIFNQPKYKPGDTLRLKAYILNKKGKRYKQQLRLTLSYYSKGKSFQKQLTELAAVSPGAYVYHFILGDSLDADRDYHISFRDRRDKTVMSGSFKIEDYLLDEVVSYSLRSEKEIYYNNDTLVFYATAKDANGLSLMDGRARLYLVTDAIPGFYQQQVIVPDTLWQQEKTLLVEGDTRFEIPAALLPDADLNINATIEFKNSNNEVQEKEIEVKLNRNPMLISVTQEGGYITAEYLVNGISMPANGKLFYGDEDMERDVKFPFKEKINPFSEAYHLWIENEYGKIAVFKSADIEKNADVIFSRVQSKDSAGFSLYNPLKAQVHYNILYGPTVIASGNDTAENITWIEKLPKSKIYTVTWNYIWGGEEHKGSNSIALLSKLLNTTIHNAGNVYPGQTDTITVSVQDYKGKPAAAVNLTAVSYNNQFSKDIKVPEPPYQQYYRYRSRLLIDDYELETVGFASRQLLGSHQQWRNIFRLDTMLYYRFLFPSGGRYSSAKYLNDFIPQLSVHAVQKGVPQEIYLLYINRKLVWYNGVTDSCKYAFVTPPGYVQIGLRLRDKYVEIDSVYVQPYYKHDMVFDMDMLPPHAKVILCEDSYSYIEQQQLEQQLLRVSNDYRTNGGYIWQNNHLVTLSQSEPHIVGPFLAGDSIQFFKPDAFDLKFAFEPGYEYTLSPKMARLEKKPLFTQKSPVKLPAVKKTEWRLGDTVPSLPVIAYTKEYTPPYLLTNDYQYTRSNRGGSVSIQLPGDSSFVYAILYGSKADSNVTRIKNYQLNRFGNVSPGIYNLILITEGLVFLEIEGVKIVDNATTCVKIDKPVYKSHNLFAETLHLNQLKKTFVIPMPVSVKGTTYTPVISGLPMPQGSSAVVGNITDKKGKSPVPGATVIIKGYATGTVTNEKGYFAIRSIRQGVYTLLISAIGYETKALQVSLQNEQTSIENLELQPSESALQEVVVVGYGVRRKSNLTASVSIVRAESLTQVLQGRAAGIQIAGTTGNSSGIILRGATSMSGDIKPIYVVNGVVMDELPVGMDMDKMQISTLKGGMAVNLYGSRAANGVIIITTPEFSPKSIRDNFKDYAVWQPNLITDKEGKVQFVTTYPDNITSWQTFVLGMDKRKRITKTSTIIRSFKPMLAQLATPQFLIEGDSAAAIGKLINYTTEPAVTRTTFKINDSTTYTETRHLPAKASRGERLPLVAVGDTIKAQYNLQLQSGYADGELRKIPVYKKGTEESRGIFSILNGDTSISFTPDPAAGKTILYIQDNPLDVLLDELRYLKQYPYFCMEQTASKLLGLLLERQIRKTLQQPFTGEKEIKLLLGKLQKAQLFNGGWSWWEGGNANLTITNYVTRSLLLLKEDKLVQTNLRNATLYLQDVLPGLKKDELLDVLYTLSEAGHIMDYSPYLQKIKFDSLTIHQQWLAIAIKQKQQLPYSKEWNVVMDKKIETMLGGIHWGVDSYRWQDNEVATTVLAYLILQREQKHQDYLQKITQYFLERRRSGRWRNTVESASICGAILPMVIQQQPKYNIKPIVNIKSGESVSIDRFPFVTSISNLSQPIRIAKQGGGMMYVTAWQKSFNPDPMPVTSHFIINNRFEREGKPVARLQAGEKTTMKISVNVLKDAEYVLIEIPIPAGCTYADKPQSWNTNREYLKDKLVVFAEYMAKGNYEYSIELEPRYPGIYHLNPVKAELMYFTTFFGRNGMKRIEIESERASEVKQ